MERIRTQVRELETGDIVQQHFTVQEDGKPVEESRHVVVGSADMVALIRKGCIHSAVRVTGVDVKRGRAVIWLAVPDQQVTVVRV